MKKHIDDILQLLLLINILLISMLPSVAKAASVQPFLDLLAWHAAESNSSWATTLTFPNNGTDVIQSNVSFNTRPGLKLGFLYAAEDCFWDTKFYWTYFSTSTTKTIPIGEQIVTSLFFSGSFFISTDVFFGGSANWQLTMNMFDLEASHAFKPIPSLTFTPKVGVKGGSINQAIDAEWNAILFTATEKVTNNFMGIGPSFGLDSKWNAYQELNLVGNIAAAFMYGRWNVNDIYTRPSAFFGLITPTTISTSMNHSKLGTLMMDYYLGLEWTHKGRSHVTVRLGYEMQYWANQLRLVTIQQLPTLGDLTIQGATCGITIDL